MLRNNINAILNFVYYKSFQTVNLRLLTFWLTAITGTGSVDAPADGILGGFNMTIFGFRIGQIIGHYLKQVRGNVTLVVGLSILPIASAIGGGIDFSNVLNARGRLQDAADSAAIAAALDSGGTLDQQKVAAQSAFASNVAGSNLSTATGSLSSDIVNNVQTMTFVATAHVPTTVLKLVGINTVDISATAKAGVSINSAEIAFVLDNTGSMAQNNKMASLKTSLDGVLASLLDSNGNNYGATKVALVPFDTQVALDNVASMGSYSGSFAANGYTCTGLNSGQCTAVVNNYSDMCGSNSACLSNNINYTASYTSNGKSYYSVMSTSYYQTNQTYSYNRHTYNYYLVLYEITTYKVSGTTLTQSSTSSNSTYTQSAAYYSPPNGYNYQQYTGTISSTAQAAGGFNSGSTVVNKDNNTITSNDDLLGVTTGAWTGCVIDRVQSYDVTSDAPVTTNTDTLYPAAKCATNSLLPIMGLTTDIASARLYAAKMTPAGNTNITIGVQWGMEVLSPSAPFTEGADFTDTTKNKYMIILTDGLNTQNRWTTTASSIDARTALACANAKKLGITIFTVRLQDGNSDMLQACATQNDYYYNLSSATQINGALGGIMKSIKKIRLTN